MGDDVVVVDKKDLLMALGFFKDWSNFMLVTTVAALGWTAKVETNGGCRGLQLTSVVFFALSIAFAVFTLALVPLVAEEIAGGAKSMYAVEANFNVLPDAWPFNALHDWLKKDCSPFNVLPDWMKKEGWPRKLTLKCVCWPQHVLFLLGIVFYSAWSFTRNQRPASSSAGS